MESYNINNKLYEYNILEFTYYPSNFPSISSYYLMTSDQILKFECDYKELNNIPLHNFLFDDILTDTNSSYHIYANHKSEYFKKIYDFLEVSTKGGSCDLLEKFYELFNKQNLLDKNNSNYNKIILSVDNFDSDNNLQMQNNYNDQIIINNNNSDKNDSSDDSVYRETENIVNIINMFNKNNNDMEIIDKINDIINKNPKLLEDNEISEIKNMIDHNVKNN